MNMNSPSFSRAPFSTSSPSKSDSKYTYKSPTTRKPSPSSLSFYRHPTPLSSTNQSRSPSANNPSLFKELSSQSGALFFIKLLNHKSPSNSMKNSLFLTFKFRQVKKFLTKKIRSRYKSKKAPNFRLIVLQRNLTQFSAIGSEYPALFTTTLMQDSKKISIYSLLKISSMLSIFQPKTICRTLSSKNLIKRTQQSNSIKNKTY